ncbi:hypothetical protein EVAR_54371_1 [Eumeta japonica]|uniref:Uncharacterized protein n=1 Tax=Eumeta variegata TaxID=151549 RepID=A0A4C1Y6U9_EUMVA|nr:hypothetical protein EVAR_54371_1 [Eumeta japonica]
MKATCLALLDMIQKKKIRSIKELKVMEHLHFVQNHRFVVERQIRGSAVGCMLHVNACCRQASTMDSSELTPNTIQDDSVVSHERAAVHADASLTQVGERQMSNAAERGGRLCLFVARSALSLALQALSGTPQSEVTPHETCFSRETHVWRDELNSGLPELTARTGLWAGRVPTRHLRSLDLARRNLITLNIQFYIGFSSRAADPREEGHGCLELVLGLSLRLTIVIELEPVLTQSGICDHPNSKTGSCEQRHLGAAAPRPQAFVENSKKKIPPAHTDRHGNLCDIVKRYIILYTGVWYRFVEALVFDRCDVTRGVGLRNVRSEQNRRCVEYMSTCLTEGYVGDCGGSGQHRVPPV